MCVKSRSTNIKTFKHREIDYRHMNMSSFIVYFFLNVAQNISTILFFVDVGKMKIYVQSPPPPSQTFYKFILNIFIFNQILLKISSSIGSSSSCSWSENCLKILQRWKLILHLSQRQRDHVIHFEIFITF